LAIFKDNIIRHAAVLPFGGNIITSDIKQGCLVMQNQAEQLKVKFGKAIADEASENEIVSIPGLRDRTPKEISLKNLAYIIEARMEEIIELVYSEIVRSGYANSLAAGIVITGGGSQLQNLVQLVEYLTGMDARIGYPNEHLGKSKIDAVKSPMYATTVGLVLAGYRSLDDRLTRYAESKQSTETRTNEQRVVNTKQPASGDFFKKILDRTKGLLIDDFDDKQNY
jgi:cell division protein FtsA